GRPPWAVDRFHVGTSQLPPVFRRGTSGAVARSDGRAARRDPPNGSGRPTHGGDPEDRADAGHFARVFVRCASGTAAVAPNKSLQQTGEHFRPTVVALWRRLLSCVLRRQRGGLGAVERLYFPCRVRPDGADVFVLWYEDE